MIDKKDKIFITGATGLIGSYVARLLWYNGYKHIKASRRSTSKMGLIEEIAEHIEWVEADVTDLLSIRSAMQGVDAVIHTAAVVSFDPRKADAMDEVNVSGTAHIVNAALDLNIKRLVHISSVAALGYDPNSHTRNEDTAWDPAATTTAYSVSKYKSEKEVWRAMAEGLPAIILNPSFVLGGGYWGESSAAIWQKIDQGIPFYPAGNNGYVDVRDIAKACMIALESDIVNERFVLSAESIPYEYSLQQMAKIIGAKPPGKKITPWLAHIAWRLDWLRSRLSGGEQVLTKSSAHSTSLPTIYDSSKSQSILGMSYRSFDDSAQEVGALYLATKKQGYGILAKDSMI